MLKVVFNEDGSINELIVMESINQGSNNVNKVFASILGRSNEDYTCIGEFELPSGDLEELSGVVDSQEVGQSTLDGYTISLAESVTRQAGNLKLNLKLIDLQDNVLCTYQVTLKVNKTGYEPSTTHITEAQYNALLQSLNGYALNLDLDNYYTKSEIDTKFEDYYTIAQVQANYYDKTYINTYLYTRAAVDLLLAEKQKVLTAGAGITILEDGTISATTSLALAYYPSLQALPSVGALNTIYMIPSSQPAEPNNNYDEYIWDTTNTRYEKIGTISTQVDLSNYYNKTEADARYVQKTTAGTYSKVYVKSVSGVDTTMYADERVIEGAIVQRGANGQIFVPATPTDNAHAASKQYVDTKASDSDVIHKGTSNEWVALSYNTYPNGSHGWNTNIGTNQVTDFTNTNYIEFKYVKRLNPESGGEPYYLTIRYGICCLYGKSVGSIIKDSKGISVEGTSYRGSSYYYFTADDADDTTNGTLYARLRDTLPSNI